MVNTQNASNFAKRKSDESLSAVCSAECSFYLQACQTFELIHWKWYFQDKSQAQRHNKIPAPIYYNDIKLVINFDIGFGYYYCFQLFEILPLKYLWKAIICPLLKQKMKFITCFKIALELNRFNNPPRQSRFKNENVKCSNTSENRSNPRYPV